MSHRELFSEFLGNLKLDLKQAKRISYHYRKITKSLNIAFRETDSSIANRLKVGSVGRHTAIKGISDLDMLYIMPCSKYEYYNSKDNGQSALLTDVRNILARKYPEQKVRKDRLVVQVIFKNFYVEVQPVFKQNDGSFKYPDSYNGGSWKITKPLHEKAAMTEFSRDKSNNLRKLCKMIRAWKNRHGVNMGGLLIDTLAYRFLSSTSKYDNTGNGSLGVLAKEFFEYLSNEEKHERYPALGSNQHVSVKSPWFGRAAKQAYELCCDALDAAGTVCENDCWRAVFGRAFPKLKADILESNLSLASCATDVATWNDTEEFIEDKYPVDIKYSLNLDCTVTQNGFKPTKLRKMLSRGFRLSARKSLLFQVDLAEGEIDESYTVMWKVLNVGDEARRRNMIRGQIVQDKGHCTKKESTDFRGDHMVECYVIKNEVVVARAQIDVPIN